MTEEDHCQGASSLWSLLVLPAQNQAKGATRRGLREGGGLKLKMEVDLKGVAILDQRGKKTGVQERGTGHWVGREEVMGLLCLKLDRKQLGALGPEFQATVWAVQILLLSWH